MKKGDYVFVVRPEVLTGGKRPSLATIIHKDDDRVLVESTYCLLNALPGHSQHSRWIVPIGSCIPVKKSVIQCAEHAEHPKSKLRKSDLVTWVGGDDNLREGVVINVTAKTVEILENGTTSIRRKKKDLVIKL